jgi:hypothetical protein
MARPLRLEYPGAVYHVMNRGLARRATFRTPAEYATFLGSYRMYGSGLTTISCLSEMYLEIVQLRSVGR